MALFSPQNLILYPPYRSRVEHPLVQRIVGLGGLQPPRQNPFLNIQRPPAPHSSHSDKLDGKGKDCKDDDDDERDDDDEKRRKKKTRTVFSRSQVSFVYTKVALIPLCLTAKIDHSLEILHFKLCQLFI